MLGHVDLLGSRRSNNPQKHGSVFMVPLPGVHSPFLALIQFSPQLTERLEQPGGIVNNRPLGRHRKSQGMYMFSKRISARVLFFHSSNILFRDSN